MDGNQNKFSSLALSIAMMLTATAASAVEENFDAVKPGTLPDEWTCGVTGKGSPVWKVETDTSAPSKPNVLKQSGSGTFPWCVKQSVRITDGFVEVKFKPVGGREDQAGGLIWRFKDGDAYYIARANAIENNVSLYHVEKGRRITIKYVRAPVATNQWHTLRVEFSGKAINLIFDGKQYLGVENDQITGAGAVGVRTKADSVTAFDDFSYGGQ
jgi:Tfp pilus assembly protein FimT